VRGLYRARACRDRGAAASRGDPAARGSRLPASSLAFGRSAPEARGAPAGHARAGSARARRNPGRGLAASGPLEAPPRLSGRAPIMTPDPPTERAKLERRLQQGLTTLHLELPEATRARLLQFLELLAHWNRTYNLTAVRDVEQMLPRHLLDSLSVL